MNIVDKAVAALWPQAALRRARARAALDVLRGYEGAKVSRRTANWTSSGRSADGEIAPALSRLRNRSREQVRNNPFAARAIAGLTSKSVGTGLTAQVERVVAKPWTEFTQNCDFDDHFDLNGLQSLWARSGFESGEVLVRRVRTRDGLGIKLQTLEPDYIDTFKTGAVGDNFVIAGVEVDKQGRKQAFWLFDQHPGALDTWRPTNLQSKRVPASDIIHFGEKQRPGQLRYVPRLAVSLMKLRDNDEWDEAELVRKKIEACFVAFVTGGNVEQALGEAVIKTAADGTKTREETLSPGMIEYLAEGEQVNFGSPSGVMDSAFSKRQLHAIAAGCGVTYELLTGDLSGVNYSSIRAGMLDFRSLVEEWRAIHFTPVLLRRVYRWFEEAAFATGRLRTTGKSVSWTPPMWRYVDPDKEVRADKAEVMGGLSSLSRKLRERGLDPDKVIDEIAEERKKLKEKGISLDTVVAAGVDNDVGNSDDDDDEARMHAELARAIESMNRQGELFAEARNREPKPPVVKVDARSTINVPEREQHINVDARVEKDAVRVEAPQVSSPVSVTVPERDVNITVEQRRPGKVEIERDQDGRPIALSERDE